jgi:hypothetical protein
MNDAMRKNRDNEDAGQPMMNDCTLRDFFAASALEGIISMSPNRNMKECTVMAYKIADAMMEARRQ